MSAYTPLDLVDEIFPEEPVRQWLLTVPVALRYRMAFDAGLTAEVLRAFVRALDRGFLASRWFGGEQLEFTRAPGGE